MRSLHALVRVLPIVLSVACGSSEPHAERREPESPEATREAAPGERTEARAATTPDLRSDLSADPSAELPPGEVARGESGHPVGRRGPDPLAPLANDPFGGATLEELDALGAGGAVAPALSEASPSEASPAGAEGDPTERTTEPTSERTTEPTTEPTAALSPLACAPLGEALRVWPRAAYADVVAVGDAFVVAGYAATRDAAEEPTEELFVVRVRPGEAPAPVFRELLERPLVRTRMSVPGLGAIGDDQVGLALVDGSAAVRFRRVGLRGQTLGGWQTLGDHVDARYPPLVVGGEADAHFVAWTVGNRDGMRLQFARFDGTGAKLEERDLTPASAGATAPVSIAGRAELPEISFLDAHVATSNILRARLGGELQAGEVEVIRPVANTFDPPMIAVAQLGPRYVLAYTAVGDMARTAVGVTTLEQDGALANPLPLIPSAGYGLLHVDVAAKPAGAQTAVFVGDASRGVDASSPREVRVRVVRGAERGLVLGEPLVLRGPDGSARFGRVARRRDGVYAVSYRSGAGTYLRFLRCAE